MDGLVYILVMSNLCLVCMLLTTPTKEDLIVIINTQIAERVQPIVHEEVRSLKAELNQTK